LTVGQATPKRAGANPLEGFANLLEYGARLNQRRRRSTRILREEVTNGSEHRAAEEGRRRRR
jgi:hypothetical protein